jgi:translocation and assembly module TamB
MLLQAVTALGASGGNFLAGDIADQLGVDISFKGGTSPEDSEVQIGRYLAPNLYVSYGIGLFDAVNTLNVRFDLTRNILVESTSSAESSSVDLLYSIEK